MYEILLLIWIHFVADFLLQSDKMALNKSSSNEWLAIHVGIYTLPFFIFGWQFALINGAAHFITDYFTSRYAKRLWIREERHWFFVIVGLDQAIHLTTLVVTYELLIGF